MAGVEGKGKTKFVTGRRKSGEAEIINGRLRVRVVARGTPREGTGSAQLKGGIESKGEVVIINGAVRVQF